MSNNLSKSQRRRQARQLRLNLALESVRDLFSIHDLDQVQEILLDIFHRSQITDIEVSREDRETQWLVYRDLRRLIDSSHVLMNG